MKELVKTALMRLEKLKEDFKDSSIFVGHSGGKDSVVITHLASQVFDKPLLLHTPKLLESDNLTPEEKLTQVYQSTLNFLYSNVAQKYSMLFLPKQDMQTWIKRLHLQVQIDGSRCYETSRQNKSSTYEVEGKLISREDLTVFNNNGLFGLKILYPIYDWTDVDVWRYIIDNKLEFSEEYLENGEYKKYCDIITSH